MKRSVSFAAIGLLAGGLSAAVVLSLVPLSASVSFAAANSADHAQTVTAGRIAAAMRAQLRAASKSIEVRFALGAGNTPKLMDCRYVRSPGLLYLQTTSKYTAELESYDLKTKEFRALSTKRAPDSGIIQSGWNGAMMGTQIMYDPLLRAVDDDENLIDVAARSKIVGREKADGFACFKLEAAPLKNGSEGTSKLVIWVDPKIGFAPRRLEFAGTSKTLVTFSDYIEYLPGVWLPKLETAVGRAAVPNSKPLRYRSSSQVERVERFATVAAPTGIRFPRGTSVYDRVHQRYVEP